jgi:hypothetical protein
MGVQILSSPASHCSMMVLRVALACVAICCVATEQMAWIPPGRT